MGPECFACTRLHCTVPIQGGLGADGAKLLLMRYLGRVTSSPHFSSQPALDEAKGPAATSRGNGLRTSPGVQHVGNRGDESRPYIPDGGHLLPLLPALVEKSGLGACLTERNSALLPARISRHLTAEAGDKRAIISLRLLAVLNVLSRSDAERKSLPTSVAPRYEWAGLHPQKYASTRRAARALYGRAFHALRLAT